MTPLQSYIREPLESIRLLVLILVKTHKRALETLEPEAFYKLQAGKIAGVVSGWLI